MTRAGAGPHRDRIQSQSAVGELHARPASAHHAPEPQPSEPEAPLESTDCRFQSIARPGGNATGLSNFGRDLVGKRLQILKDLVPGLSRVAFLINPNVPVTRMFVDVTQSAATELGLQLRTFDAHSIDEVEPAFDAIAKAGMQAVTIGQGGVNFQARATIPKLALARGLPLCATSRETFEHGALASYGPDLIEMCYRSTVYVDKILKGAKPGDIPVEQPTKFELLINLKTAKALGLQIPLHVQQLAHEMIE